MSDRKTNVRLLLVDDEKDFLESTSRALERRGIFVRSALDGEEALASIGRSEFDVVVLDLKMPGMSGIEVFDRLRESWPDIPVIMLTGHGTVDDAFLTAKQGIFDFIPKPCEPDLLAERIHAAAASAEPSPSEAPPPGPAQPIRLLIVDDEAELLDSLKTVLSRRGMEVKTALNGMAALEILQHSPVDVVVLDIKMPGMDGLEVLEKIKAQHPSVEVILLTGHPATASALAFAASDYIEKPPDVEELRAAILAANQQRQKKAVSEQRATIEELKGRPD